MAQTTSGSTLALEELTRVVDTDAHVRDSISLLLPYMSEENESSRRIIANARRPMADIYSSTHGLPSSVFVGPDESASSRTASPTAASRESYESDEKLFEMEEFGIDFGILDPSTNLALNTCENPQIAVALANAYNSWILAEYTDETDAFNATILVAPHKPDVAAEEIDDRAGEDDMVGVMIPSTGVLPPLGHPQYDPIYEAAADHGLPVAMHGGNNSTTHHFPTQRMWNETYTENHVIVHPFGHMWNLTTMIVRGTMARFPDVNFVFQESGIAWVPYTKWRLDDHYLMRPYEFYADQLPSETIDDQCYFTTQPLGHTTNPTDLATAIELAGPENIMYASDLPHVDFDPPEELFNRINGYFDADTVRKIMGETATEVFDIAT